MEGDPDEEGRRQDPRRPQRRPATFTVSIGVSWFTVSTLGSRSVPMVPQQYPLDEQYPCQCRDVTFFAGFQGICNDNFLSSIALPGEEVGRECQRYWLSLRRHPRSPGACPVLDTGFAG